MLEMVWQPLRTIEPAVCSLISKTKQRKIRKISLDLDFMVLIIKFLACYEHSLCLMLI